MPTLQTTKLNIKKKESSIGTIRTIIKMEPFPQKA